MLKTFGCSGCFGHAQSVIACIRLLKLASAGNLYAADTLLISYSGTTTGIALLRVMNEAKLFVKNGIIDAEVLHLTASLGQAGSPLEELHFKTVESIVRWEYSGGGVSVSQLSKQRVSGACAFE